MKTSALGKTLSALALLAAVGGVAWAAGYTTNGLPTTSSQLTGNELIAADTQLPSGQTPQSEAISTTQLRNFDPPPFYSGAATTYTPGTLNYHTFYLNPTANFTLANPAGLQDGGTYKWIVTQDATGSRVATYGSLFTFSGSSTLSTTANYVDLISCTYAAQVPALLCAVTLHYH